MTAGLQNLKHIVVVMMENRSFDHMLGSLKGVNPNIDGLTGNEFNLDTTNEPAKVHPSAKWQSQLDPDPDHHFPAVNKQIFDGGPVAEPTMGGFVKSYWDQQRDVNHSREIMYYFAQDKLPVLTTLALKYTLFNGWFASIPGPTLCNRAFAHYGTSFGQVSQDIFYFHEKPLSVYQRLNNVPGHSAKVYYYDEASSSLEVVNLLQNQPALFGTYKQFLEDCDKGELPQYCFIEPNYSDHEDAGGELVACDQHPDHDVQQGEAFLAEVYNKIRTNPVLWKSTAMLVLYDEHGGIYDHVKPPTCPPDGFQANPDATGVPGLTFKFDRLGVRVPAILISPWVPEGKVVPGPYEGGRAFEHASIPHTVTQFFIGDYADATPREKASPTFLDLLTDTMRTEEDCPVFQQE